LPSRLTKIDELTRSDHFHLSEADECYYLREYTSGSGYQASDTNQLIANLKKGVDRRGRPEYRHKIRAMETAAQELRANLNPDWLRHATLVPIPPSSSRTHILYDDRMTQVLRQMTAEVDGDVRELVVTRASMVPAHVSNVRPSVEELMANYEIDESAAAPEPTIIGVFDDVLTAGSHFKAVKNVLSTRFPQVPIMGIFIARRIFPPMA
jgi:hypothetical protein